jgi:multicomponent K+:H+ antiporter subunit E
MRRLLPAPRLSALLLLAWPLLNQSWSLGQLLLGAALALAIPLLTGALQRDRTGPRRTWAALALAAVVLRDIVVANLQAARLILGPEAALQPRFVWLPLSMSDPHGLVALASIVTLTPGTVSAELSADRRHLLIHVLSLDDEATLAADIRQRYEVPLRAIFEGSERR